MADEIEASFEHGQVEQGLFADGGNDELLLVDLAIAISVEGVDVDLEVMTVNAWRDLLIFFKIFVDLSQLTHDDRLFEISVADRPTHEVVVGMFLNFLAVVLDAILEFLENSALQIEKFAVSNDVGQKVDI